MQLYQLKFPNGKSYIGITSKTAQERFKEHCAKSSKCKLLKTAIAKYGKENVQVIVIAECDNYELLCLSEVEAIEKFNTFHENGKGYNLTIGGEGSITVNIFGEERKERDKKRRLLAYGSYREKAIERARTYFYENKEKISQQAKARYEATKHINKDEKNRKSKEYKRKVRIEKGIGKKLLLTEEEKKAKVSAYNKAYNQANRQKNVERCRVYKLALKANGNIHNTTNRTSE